MISELVWRFASLWAVGSIVATACGALSLIWTRRRRSIRPRSRPPISVLKPLKGVDDRLEENLAALVAQDYPEFELIFGVASTEDPALAVVERLRAKSSQARITVVTGGAPAALNPKVANLLQIQAKAQHDLQVISDSNVRPPPSYLDSLAEAYDGGAAGLVHSPLRGVGEHDVGSALENLMMNTWVASMTAWAQLFRYPVVVGKSVAFSGSELARMGGFEQMQDVLAEDYFMGRLYREAGRPVVLASGPVEVVHERQTIGEVIARQVRWSTMRRWVSPFAYAWEPLANPLPYLALIAAVSFAVADPRAADTGRIFLALWAFRTVVEAVVASLSRGGLLPPIQWPLLVVKDFLLAYAWISGLFRTRISWRGNRMRIGKGSRLRPEGRGEALTRVEGVSSRGSGGS